MLLAACAPQETPAGPAPGEAAASSFSGTDTNLAPSQLEALVARIALYPDNLLAIALPTATQPQQLVDAQRFLAERRTNPALQPEKSWDPSVVALLNYPEALALMTADLKWLLQLGTSVVNQQAGVMDAIQSFRRKALAAGHLRSDDKRIVSVRPGPPGGPEVVVIDPADPQAIQVPSYDPAAVVVSATPTAPAYPYYWSAPYPYYYDPAAPYYMGAFFGTAIGFGCDWDDHDIYYGDVNVDAIRATLKERIEARRNSGLADQIRRNPENVWRADRDGLERAQGGAAFRTALQERGAGSRGAGNRAPAGGAFSGIDRGAAASRFGARGAGSLGGFRGGGFRGGGGRGGRR
jgi:hypothetical protein